MMRKTSLILGLALLLTGCSKGFWEARVFMMKAENIYGKAYSLKFKKAPYEQRLQYYRKACLYFYEAYRRDPNVFTLNRIHDGSDSCWRVGDTPKEEAFAAFEAAYAKRHPKEFEYGDTDATIPE